MLSFKHYSFDLWLTLIKSNPRFKEERARYFYSNFNYKKKSFEEVKHIFRQLDLMCNAINEKTGKNIDADEMYLMVISLINENEVSLKAIDTDGIYQDMENLLLNYLPFVYCAETSGVLDHLKQKKNLTLSVLSNTGFIKGVTLRKVLKELELDNYFDFQLYSDETGLSKPNVDLFKLMLRAVDENKKVPEIKLKEIIHIGDNPKADIEGAEAVGISSLLINSNDKRILSLLN